MSNNETAEALAVYAQEIMALRSWLETADARNKLLRECLIDCTAMLEVYVSSRVIATTDGQARSCIRDAKKLLANVKPDEGGTKA